jgi:sensor histidine kinase YesM
MIKQVPSIINLKLVQHLGFWLTIFFVLTGIFSGNKYWDTINLVYSALFLFSLILAIEVQSNFTIPYFLHNEKFELFSISFIAIAVLGAGFNYWFFMFWVDYIFPKYFFISYYSYWELLLFFAVFLIVALLLHMAKSWINERGEKEQRLELEKEKAIAELKALRHQMDPHFLFNSLNLLYSLSEKQSEKTSEAVLKLSDLLRYVTYETNKEWVSLEKELLILNKYISLQKMRLDSSIDISVENKLDDESMKIPVMILLPIVENAFKHGINSRVQNQFLHIIIDQCENKLLFVCKNSYKAKANGLSGLGLNNIKKRLNLLFENQWDITITHDTETYQLNLKIPMTDEN